MGILKHLLIDWFLVALGLHCCAQAFSSYRAWGPLFTVEHGRFLLWRTGSGAHGLQELQQEGSVLWLTGLAALWHVESSRTRDQTRVPYKWPGWFQPTAPPVKSTKSFLRTQSVSQKMIPKNLTQTLWNAVIIFFSNPSPCRESRRPAVFS